MDTIRDYNQDLELIKEFFVEKKDKYDPLLTDLANRDAVCLHIEMRDVDMFNEELADQIKRKTQRYLELFYLVLDQLLPSYKTKEVTVKDTLDIIIEQRQAVAERFSRLNSAVTNALNSSDAGPTTNSQRQGATEPVADVDGAYPPELNRRYEVYFIPSDQITTPIRHVLANQIGNLITVRGLVTRCSDVKPQIIVATYTCNYCGCETFQTVREPEFMPLEICTSAACKTVKNPGKLKHQISGSRFIKAQEIKLQELSEQVPTGHIPRTMRVLAHGENSRLCGPGDQILLSGVFLTQERSGYRALRSGNAADVYVEAHFIKQMSKSDEEYTTEPMSEEEGKQLLANDENFINRLSSSIAPEIYGHEQMKRALLLLLVGGVEKVVSGARTRGDINICLMGDPGVAKSQLLRFVDRLATRSQYTTGRGSSGVGLTAAVVKDPVTDELTLEGGALVLADRGICCIDEFDKMMDADRTAIHEVMEQQTVSIAKAGINTILNARVSILAAANPCYGRYNSLRSVSDNLRLPPALLSRFDLLWLIKDNCDELKDKQLADHVTRIHTNPDEITAVHDIIDMKTIRRYIQLCKLKNPYILPSHEPRLIEIFLKIRQKKRRDNTCCDSLFTSPRSLLAITRLATALARLRLAEHVESQDIEGAVKLYDESRSSIEGFIDDKKKWTLDILNVIKNHFDEPEIQIEDLKSNRVIQASLGTDYSEDDLEKILQDAKARGIIEYQDGLITYLQENWG